MDGRITSTSNSNGSELNVKRLADDETAVASAPPSTSGRAPRGPPVVAPPACPRCDVAGGAVQADVVVVLHVSAYQTPGIIER